MPRTLCGDHIGEAELAAEAKCRKPRDLAQTQASGAEEIGLEGTGVGWQPGEGSIWHILHPPPGLWPLWKHHVLSSACAHNLVNLVGSAYHSPGTLGVGREHWWRELLLLFLVPLSWARPSRMPGPPTRRTAFLPAGRPSFHHSPSLLLQPALL